MNQEEHDYLVKEIGKIDAVLAPLISGCDSRLLAAALLSTATQLYHTLWSADLIKADAIAALFADGIVRSIAPTDKKPKINYRDESGETKERKLQ